MRRIMTTLVFPFKTAKCSLFIILQSSASNRKTIEDYLMAKKEQLFYLANDAVRNYTHYDNTFISSYSITGLHKR